MSDSLKFNNVKENNSENKNNAEGIIIIIAFLVVLIFGVRFVTKMMSPPTNKDIVNNTENVYTEDTSNSDVLENVVLIHTIDYNYLGEVSTIEHDWLIHDEPDYMLDVIKACAAVVDSYFNSNVPTVYYYSISNEYAYLNSESGVCLLTPEESSMNDLIVEISREKVYLYEVVSEDSYNDISDDIDAIIMDMVVDEETQTITSGLYKYEFSSSIPENYKDIIRQLHKEVGFSYQTYFIYDEKDGKIFVLLDSCEEYYMTVNNKSYISSDIKEKLESLDTSGETISDTNYRSLTEEEFNYIKQVCYNYDIDINESIVEFDVTTDTYIVRAEQSTVFIELSTGVVDIEYTKHIDY